MGKALLFLVGAFVITGGSLIYGTVNKGSVENTERVGDYASELTAREIAHTGMQDALMKLSQAYNNGSSYTGPLTWNGSYQGGSYENTISISGQMHSVTSVAKTQGREYVMQREYFIDPMAAIPQGMRRALSSEQTITFDQDVYIEHVDRIASSANSDILSNQGIEIEGGVVCVFGFGLHKDGIDIAESHWQNESDIFLPENNPDSLTLTQVISGVEFPEIVAANYSSFATVTKTGNTDIDGYFTLGTEDNPAIWYVDGDLTTIGDVTFEGYGIIAVDGNVQIDHKIYSTGGSTFLEGNLALYANNDVVINKDTEAHIYANGTISTSTNGDPYGITVKGGLTTRSQFDFNEGSYVGVNYRLPSESIVTPIFGNDYEKVKMVSTREWVVEKDQAAY